jgi:hypothetical protein
VTLHDRIAAIRTRYGEALRLAMRLDTAADDLRNPTPDAIERVIDTLTELANEQHVNATAALDDLRAEVAMSKETA